MRDPNTLWEDFIVMVRTTKAPDYDIPICGLCGNTGKITHPVPYPGVLSGHEVQNNFYCICPNGQSSKSKRPVEKRSFLCMELYEVINECDCGCRGSLKEAHHISSQVNKDPAEDSYGWFSYTFEIELEDKSRWTGEYKRNHPDEMDGGWQFIGETSPYQYHVEWEKQWASDATVEMTRLDT